MCIRDSVKTVQHIEAKVPVGAELNSAVIESNIVRTCDPVAAEQMIELIEKVRSEGNSVGGVIECVVRGVPPGLGEPVFDKLEADLAKAMMSLPATKGFEIGSGFGGTTMTGLEHNDEFYMDGETVRTRTNRSGGIQGGISNGEEIVFRAVSYTHLDVYKRQVEVVAGAFVIDRLCAMQVRGEGGAAEEGEEAAGEEHGEGC